MRIRQDIEDASEKDLSASEERKLLLEVLLDIRDQNEKLLERLNKSWFILDPEDVVRAGDEAGGPLSWSPIHTDAYGRKAGEINCLIRRSIL